MEAVAHVAVIGGGFGGILAAVECLQVGWDVTIFEANSSGGGIWRETNLCVQEHCIGVNASTSFNTSSYASSTLLEPLLVEFVESPDCIGSNPFPTAAQFRAYIDFIVAKYQITPHMRFRHQVTSIQFQPQSGRVLVKCTDLALQQCMEQYFDFVIVAVGGYKEPHYPRIPGLPLAGENDAAWNDAPLHGHIHHACQFDARLHSDRYERVLVVGGSISAAEIVEELLVYRNQAHTVGLSSSRRLKKVFWNVSSRPDKANVWIFNKFNQNGRPLDESSRLFITLFSSCGKRYFFDSNLDNFMCADPQIMLKARQEGRLALVYPLESIQIVAEGTTIHCQLKAQEAVARPLEVDAIVFATGYRRDYSFLPESSRQELSALLAAKAHLWKDVENYKNQNNGPLDWGRPILYKDVLPLDPNLNCVGFIGTRRYSGSAFPVMQMESKWLVQHWKSGGWSPEKRLQEHERILRSDSVCKYQLSATGKDPPYIVDSLAQDLGIQPKSFLWLMQPSFYSHQVGISLLLGPWSMLHYSLHSSSANANSIKVTTDQIIFRSQQKLGTNTFHVMCSLYSLVYVITLLALPPFVLFKCL